MRKAKASDMRDKLKFYKQVNVRNPISKEIEPRWMYVFSLWGRKVNIFREQLESMQSGADTYRDRIEFETRYTDKITSDLRLMHKGVLYNISITGDTEGIHDRTRFLAEALKDGGA